MALVIFLPFPSISPLHIHLNVVYSWTKWSRPEGTWRKCRGDSAGNRARTQKHPSWQHNLDIPGLPLPVETLKSALEIMASLLSPWQIWNVHLITATPLTFFKYVLFWTSLLLELFLVEGIENTKMHEHTRAQSINNPKNHCSLGTENRGAVLCYQNWLGKRSPVGDFTTRNTSGINWLSLGMGCTQNLAFFKIQFRDVKKI